jgi:quercetin dioxygenase-like cupin family protein
VNEPKVTPWARNEPANNWAIERLMREEGLAPRLWSNGPGDRYASHEHGYHKVLYCCRGSITFVTPEGEIRLSAGDRMDLPPHTQHSAVVGPEGVECVEAESS